MPAHHGKGNATALFCSLVCLQRVGISSGHLYFACLVPALSPSRTIVLVSPRKLWALEKPLWRDVSSFLVHTAFLNLQRSKGALKLFETFFKALSVLLFSFALLNFDLWFCLPFLFFFPFSFLKKNIYFSQFLDLLVVDVQKNRLMRHFLDKSYELMPD